MDPQSPLARSLSIEENILIRSACGILEAESKQSRFKFWGKVLGTQNDYYLVQSTILHPFRMATTYYSRDARIWQSLPSVSPSLRKRSPRLNGMFTGDPTFRSNFVEYHYAGDNYYEPTTMAVKEEERLAYLVYCIDSEGLLIPKNSYGLDEKGFLVANPAYQGLSYQELRNFDNYLLYKPLSVQKTGNGFDDIGIEDPAYHVLKPLTDTLNHDNLDAYGPWIFHDADDENCIVLEHTHWVGLYFWHNIDTASFGRCYFGRGDKDINVPFVLGSPDDQDFVINIDIVPDYDYRAEPADAIKAAEDEFRIEEARLERLLPPLPVKAAPIDPDNEQGLVSDGETDDPSAASEEEAASGVATSAEVTDVSDQEDTSGDETDHE